jgi:hypothetical protein
VHNTFSVIEVLIFFSLGTLLLLLLLPLGVRTYTAVGIRLRVYLEALSAILFSKSLDYEGP